MKKDPICNTGDEVKILKMLKKLRRSVDTIGGNIMADNLRKRLDKRLTECYCLLTGSKIRG